MYRPGYNRLLAQPLGVVGVVAPWNYPYQLSMLPAVAALAAGNRVMIKPSELTPRTAELMARIVGETFGEDELAVFPGDATVGKAFVELPFDHLFFTGSTAVGRIVAQAAAKNLTPVTLELGGKSPVIVDAEGAFESIAPKIAIGKLFNAGQTCIAPDYALVPRARVDEFVAAMTRAIGKLYPTLAGNADYTSIVNERHYARLAGLLADARTRGARVVEVNPAAEALAPAARKLAPALILDAGDDDGRHARGDLRPAAAGGRLRQPRRRDRLREPARPPAGALLVRRQCGAPRPRAAAARSPGASPSTAASRISRRRRSRSAASARAGSGRITACTAFARSARKSRSTTRAASASCRCCCRRTAGCSTAVLAWFARGGRGEAARARMRGRGECAAPRAGADTTHEAGSR